MSSEQKLDLNQLQNDVQNEIENEDHSKIAKICRTVLASKPNELLWLRLLCCAMIHLSETKQLLTFIETYSNKHQIYNALLFYKIYGLYLLKQTKEAQQMINKLDTQTTKQKRLSKQEWIGIQFLKFQIFYRLGQYKSGLSILQTLFEPQKENTNEIIINEISALIAVNQSSNAIQKYLNTAQSTHLNSNCDFVFNLATALILCERVSDAKQLLLSALNKCESALVKDGYDSKEIRSEIGNLELLIAYCLYSEGSTDKALEYLQKLNENKCLNGVYQNLILRNNICAMSNDKTDLNGLYKKLLNKRNRDNLKWNETQTMKAYYNQCILCISDKNDLKFKQTLSEMKKFGNKSKEMCLFLKMTHFLSKNGVQQSRDILFEHISNNPNCSVQARLFYIQILINSKKYQKAIAHISESPNEIKYSPKIVLKSVEIAVNKLNNRNLAIQIIEDCIANMSDKNDTIAKNLVISLRIRLCHLLLSLNRAKEAQTIANDLYKIDSKNERFKALLLMTAIKANDIDLAQKISNEIEMSEAKMSEFELSELVSDIPKPESESKQENMPFSFEINAAMETERKRKINRKKRAKKAAKLRQKFKDNPLLYKEAIDWESKKEKNERNNKANKTKKGQKKSKKKKNKNKKKGFKGAQGGSVSSNRYEVYDIGHPSHNKNKRKTIPKHIQKRR